MKLFGNNKTNNPGPGPSNTNTKPEELTEDQKQANLAAGLNEDGSPKLVELTEDQKKAHLAAGLNEDGSPKNVESVTFNTTDKAVENTATEEYVPSEFVIKEMMHQKGCSREEAIKRLKNPN